MCKGNQGNKWVLTCLHSIQLEERYGRLCEHCQSSNSTDTSSLHSHVAYTHCAVTTALKLDNNDGTITQVLPDNPPHPSWVV